MRSSIGSRAPSLCAGLLLLAGCQPMAGVQASDSPTVGSQTGASGASIHERVVTLDTHKDIQPQLAPRKLPKNPAARLRVRQQFDPTYRGEQQVDFPKMREGAYDSAFFIVYVGQGALTEAGYKKALMAANAKFDAVDRMCELHAEHIELARTPADVERIVGSGKLCACIGIENGYPMGLELANIAEFHRRGARYMSIAHNGHTQLGDSHTPAEPMHGGLSELGRKAVAELNRVGIMIDVSHAAKATMLEVLKRSKAPVLASHSGCRALCDHTRNLDDEQLLALKENGGVVQCVALGSFVKDAKERRAAIAALREQLGLPRRFDANSREIIENFDEKMVSYNEQLKAIDARLPQATVSDFVDHIDHAVKLIGIDHVGISSDFDGGGGVDGWMNAAETPNVTAELLRRGYTEEQIAKIWSGNTLRVWREVERVASEMR